MHNACCRPRKRLLAATRHRYLHLYTSTQIGCNRRRARRQLAFGRGGIIVIVDRRRHDTRLT